MGLLKKASRGAKLCQRLLGGRRRQFPVLLALFLCLGLGSGTLQSQESLEYPVKAAFLLKFGDYVEWPPNALPAPGAPFAVGVLGKDPFGGNLDLAVKDRSVQGRPIIVKRFERVEQVKEVQILFIGPVEPEELEGVLVALSTMSVLTVSDGPVRRGVVIRFVIQENRVHFEIDADAAQRANLKLSSKLLSLASVVEKTKPIAGG